MNSKIQEILCVLVIVFGLLLFVSLASHSPFDWPASTAGVQHNLIGKFGAYQSHWLLLSMGYSAYVVVLSLILIAYHILKAKTYNYVLFKVLGAFMLVVSASVMLTTINADGGILGGYLSSVLIKLIGRVGIFIVFAALIVMSALIATNISLKSILDILRNIFSSLSLSLKQKYLAFKVERRERQEAAKAEAQTPVSKKKVVKMPEAPAEGGGNGAAPKEKKEPEIVMPAQKKKIIDLNEKKKEAEEKRRQKELLEKARRLKKQAENKENGIEEETAEGEQKVVNFNPDAYEFPPLDLLEDNDVEEGVIDENELKETSQRLEETLKHFNIDASVKKINPGPVLTLFELEPAPGVSVSKIVSREDDIALALAAKSIRIVAPIPGKGVIGIEIPNKSRRIVKLKELIENEEMPPKNPMKVALGRDILGNPVFIELNDLPHLLIAGATGSGKSVCVNSLLINLIMNSKPDEVKLILIDPKMVEMSFYNNMGHLILPVVTDPKEATRALRWAVAEMESRYKLLSGAIVKNIKSYNNKMEKEGKEKMPYIVIVVDELADLMAVSSNECELYITRLAQMSRAVGLHMILATQRPSVNVITGLIKANMPARVSFAVSSKIDSRTILDTNGAETLLGKGDMLYISPRESHLTRIQGIYISEYEMEKVVNYVKDNWEAQYNLDILKKESRFSEELSDDDKEYLEEAKKIVIQTQRGSINLIQRRLNISYNRAARLMDKLEEDGIVGPAEGPKARDVLISFEEYFKDEFPEQDIDLEGEEDEPEN